MSETPNTAAGETPEQVVHLCLFCGKQADHKCGDDDDCGNCCAMRGGLAHDDPHAYKWLEEFVRPHIKRLKDMSAAQSQQIEELKAKVLELDERHVRFMVTGEPVVMATDYDKLKAELTALRERSARLEEALLKYGTHLPNCPTQQSFQWADCKCQWVDCRALLDAKPSPRGR